MKRSLIRRSAVAAVSAVFTVTSLLTVMPALVASAEDEPMYTEDGFAYVINEGGTVTITGLEPDRQFDRTKLIFPSTIDGKDVTAIDSNKFSWKECTELVLPAHIEKINNWAFSETTSLKEVTIPATLQQASNVFRNSGVEKVIFEDGMTAIPDSIFSESFKVKEIVIPDTVTTIGSSSFWYCEALEKIELPDSVRNIGNSAFSNCSGVTSIDIPDQLDSIGRSVFAYCRSLESVTVSDQWNIDPDNSNSLFSDTGIREITFGKGITTIPAEICENCENLETINWPDAPVEIKGEAFRGCISLKDPKLPETIEYIGGSAFSRCSAIEKLDLPAGLKNISPSAFYGTTSLTYLYMPVQLPVSGYYGEDSAFSQSGIRKLEFAEGITEINAKTRGLPDLTEVVIPDSVTTIRNYAFSGDESLSELHLPDSITTIESSNTFEKCYSLRELVIPAGLTSAKWAFSSAPALEKIIIADGMETIPEGAFINCNKLETAVFPESLTKVCSSAFSNCENLETIEMEQDSIAFDPGAFEYCDNLWDERVSTAGYGDLFVNSTFVPDEEGGFTNYTIYHRLNPRFSDVFSESKITVETSEKDVIIAESLPGFSGTTSKGFTINSEEESGVIRFSVRHPEGKNVKVTAEYAVRIHPESPRSWDARHIIIGGTETSRITLTAPETVGKTDGKSVFSVYGSAPFGESITILVNGEEYTTVTSSQYTGRYSAKIDCTDVDGRITVQAVCGDYKSQVAEINAVADRPVLVDFDVSHNNLHNYWHKDLTEIFTRGAEPYLLYNPTQPFEFDVEMGNTDNVAKVLVVSDVNGRTSYVGLDKDSETGRYKGSGFFDTPVPGKLSVRTVPKNREDTLTVKKGGDGAIGSIKNKAGKELSTGDPTAPKDPAVKFVEETEQTVIETGNNNIAVSFRRKPKTSPPDTGSAPYLPPGEDCEIRVFEGMPDSIDIGGRTVKPINIVEDHEDFNFEKSNTTVVDENGDKHEYYVKIVTKEDSDFAQSFTKSIPLTSDSSDTRSVNDFLTENDLSGVIEGIVIADLNKDLGTAEFIAVAYTGDEETNSLFKDLTVGAGTSYILEKAVLDNGLKDAAGAAGAGFTALQEAGNLYDHYYSHSYRSVRVDYSKDPFVQEHATELKVTSAALFIGRAAIAAVAVKGAVVLAAAGLALWPGILAGAALTFGVWAMGQVYNKLEKGLDEVTDGVTGEGEVKVGIDPSGIAYEWLLSNPVEGVTAEIYYQDDSGNAVKWNAEDYDQENPQITDSAGWFAWDVPQGMWQVRISGEGYEDAQSEWLPVLPVQTDVNISLTSKEAAEIADAGYADGRVMVKFSKYMLDSTVSSDSIVLADKGGKAVECDIAPVKEEGNDTAASRIFILTPKSDISLADAKVGVKAGAQSYAGVACKDSDLTALRALSDGELPQQGTSYSGLGDVNEDGFVDSGDASLILSEYALLSTGSDSSFTEAQRAAADVNSDDVIDSSDASSILAYYAMASTATEDVPSMAEYMAGNAA